MLSLPHSQGAGRTRTLGEVPSNFHPQPPRWLKTQRTPMLQQSVRMVSAASTRSFTEPLQCLQIVLLGTDMLLSWFYFTVLFGVFGSSEWPTLGSQPWSLLWLVRCYFHFHSPLLLENSPAAAFLLIPLAHTVHFPAPLPFFLLSSLSRFPFCSPLG